MSLGFSSIVCPYRTDSSLHALCLVQSPTYRGCIMDAALHFPTFSQMSNVIGSTQNTITLLFIHKRTPLAASALPTFSQTSSHSHVLSRNPHSLPMMPFQHVAVPQDENLNYITGSDLLLWRALFHLRSLPSPFFRLGFKKTKTGETSERRRRRKRESSE